LKGAQPPYVPKIELEDEETRELVSDKVEDIFGQMIAAQTRG
jgi:hypothetical protein